MFTAMAVLQGSSKSQEEEYGREAENFDCR